jgi:2-polyprenyl-3-methyl-5-hydroxy-6-metoxy-1,4-benzoquinol methylase
MADTLDRVRAAYDNDPEGEWRRFQARAQMRLEYLITTYVLERHLPPLDRAPHILDAGGGPGRYTIALAERGYRVTLFDLSPCLLDLARVKIAQAGEAVQQRVVAVEEGSITDLLCFRDAQFDAVLCLGGPLSHVVDPTARRQALSELQRVARPDASLFVSVLNRLAVYRGAVQWPGGCHDRAFPHLSKAGITTIGAGKAPAYLFLPEEFVGELESAGLRIECLYGCQGLGAHLQEENLTALMGDPERWPAWRDVLLATCDHPNIVGVSSMLLAVARRQAHLK